MRLLHTSKKNDGLMRWRICLRQAVRGPGRADEIIYCLEVPVSLSTFSESLPQGLPLFAAFLRP
jgi:hypothetical protein